MEFLQKLSIYEGKKTGWLVSEKLDGHRALWCPATAGFDAKDVPFADDSGTATGLWSSGGKIIHAPEWWLNKLPLFNLDGELYAGRGQFQFVSSVVRRKNPDERWSDIQFCVSDSPSAKWLFHPRDVKIRNKLVIFKESFLKPHVEIMSKNSHGLGLFYCDVYRALSDLLPTHGQVSYVVQHACKPEKLLDQVCSDGGEGVVIRDPYGVWMPARSKSILKWKPFLDDEAKILGYTEGKGKYDGMMGAAIVEWKDKQFKVSGWTDEQRRKPLPIGTIITFRYRELSDDGVPKEARYVRSR